MESRLTKKPRIVAWNTKQSLKNRWHICINVAYLETVDPSYSQKASRLCPCKSEILLFCQGSSQKRKQSFQGRGKPISIFSHPSLTTLVEFLVNEVSLDRTRESTIGSLNTLTQSFSVSCLNILDIIAAVLDSTLGIALIRKSEQELNSGFLSP